MKFLSFLGASLCVLLPVAAALDTSALPKCGLTCIVTAAANSTCSPLDAACVCVNAPLLAEITACVTTSCSVRDQLSTEKFSNDFCGVEGEDRRPLVWILAVVFGAIGILAFGLRCLARMVGSRSWGMDDTVMCLVVLLMVALASISIPLSQHGLGLDMWYVSFDDITEILHLYYFDEVIYISALALTKVSILFFYLKVFPKKSFRIATYTLIALNLAYMITYDFLLLFQCSPIQGAWKFWDGTFEGQCISINVLGWSAAAFNIALDLAVIFLPMPELFQLSMSMKKKVQIVAMFAVGFFITVVSIVRLHSLIEFGTTTNLTQDYVEVGYWSTIEVPVGVICACMPAIRSLFSLAFPKVFGTTRQGKSAYGSSFGGPSSVQRLQSKNAISVKQEWTVLVDPVDQQNRSHARTTSEVELVRMQSSNLADVEAMPVRKMTLRKEEGAWGGRVADGHDRQDYR